jgi:hypothetical protein
MKTVLKGFVALIGVLFLSVIAAGVIGAVSWALRENRRERTVDVPKPEPSEKGKS